MPPGPDLHPIPGGKGANSFIAIRPARDNSSSLEGRLPSFSEIVGGVRAVVESKKVPACLRTGSRIDPDLNGRCHRNREGIHWHAEDSHGHWHWFWLGRLARGTGSNERRTCRICRSSPWTTSRPLSENKWKTAWRGFDKTRKAPRPTAGWAWYCTPTINSGLQRYATGGRHQDGIFARYCLSFPSTQPADSQRRRRDQNRRSFPLCPGKISGPKPVSNRNHKNAFLG